MDKLYIIKIGGHVIDDEKMLSSFLKQFSLIQGKKILVHGGGKLATRLAEKLGIQQQMIDGRRVTDKETLKIVTMVYAGYINKNIVAQLQANNCNTMGICGVDGNAILSHKREHTTTDYGYVGDIEAINTSFIMNILDQHITVVFAPITHDRQGQLLNTNADTIAQELAKALCKYFDTRLVYSFEKAGVLLDVDDESTAIKNLSREYYQQLKDVKDSSSKNSGKIFAGMIPKLDNAFAALDSGVKKVIIGKAENLEELIKGNAGTTIVNE